MRLSFCYRHVAPYHEAQLTALVQAGHTVTVLSYDDFSGAAFSRRAVDNPIYRVHVIEKPEGVWNELRRSLDESKPDVVLFPGWGHAYSLVALSWAIRQKVPTVVITDSQYTDHPRYWWQELIKRRIVQLITAGFAAGRMSCDYLIALGMPPERTAIGCDIVDNEHFFRGAREAREAGSALRKRLELPDRYYLVVNRLIPEKNVQAILNAYAAYCRKGAPGNWKLVIVGEGPLRMELNNLVRTLDIGSRVLFVSAKEYHAMPQYYALASALILASTTEPWGLVVNEAMACGIPVIVSDRCGCAADLVRDGVNGFIFSPSDPDRLTEIMVEFGSGSIDLDAMGSKAQEIISTWSLKRYVESLQSVLVAAGIAPRKMMSIIDKIILYSSIHLLNKKKKYIP
jgi:1,2-diacylglycerol 3-alpha-glucosyltransferase